VLQSLFQRPDPNSDKDTEKTDVPYRVWFAAAAAASFLAIWSTVHYELLAKIAWTITAPGFTLSQTWNERHGFSTRIVFGIVLLFHCYLMELLFLHLPYGHYGYILVIAIAEIMTVGLAYQIWIHLRSKPNEHR
jgi:hypothetical protein